jgi:hypothetical protein
MRMQMRRRKKQTKNKNKNKVSKNKERERERYGEQKEQNMCTRVTHTVPNPFANKTKKQNQKKGYENRLQLLW